MTPLQIGGYFRLAMKQRAFDKADALSTFAVGSRADGKELKAAVKEIIENGDGT